jgi:hypothetical protein
MEGFDPSTSFGPEVAARYDDQPRGDEAAAGPGALKGWPCDDHGPIQAVPARVV